MIGQVLDLLTSIWGSLCNIAKYLTHAVPTCEKVKPMVKVWFSVLIYQIFKPFTKALKYTFTVVIITRLEFLHQFLFLTL